MGEQISGPRVRIPGVLPGAAFFNDRLNDVVRLLSALPEMANTLRVIEVHITNIDSEVTLMRQGVDRLHDQVTVLTTDIGDLASGINEVSASVGRLEPHISDISRIARPIKRMRGRAGASGDRIGGEPRQLPADEEPPVAGFA